MTSPFSPSTLLETSPQARQVLRVVLDCGPVSTTRIASSTGVGLHEVETLLQALQVDGWLKASSDDATYSVNPHRALVFGADVGGTKIHAAVADLCGHILAEEVEQTDPAGGEAVIDQLARLSAALVKQAGSGTDIVSGAVGIPAAVNPINRHLTMIPNIAGLTGFSFEDALAEKLGYAVTAGNDVNMAARGEQWGGNGRNIANFVFVALGTGIGMGTVIDGRIIRGARGAAGEIASLPIGADPYDSRTFHSGALESTISSAAMIARYEGLGGTPGLTVRELFDDLNDPLFAVVLDETARTLAVALLAISSVVDPEEIIFGGSVGARPELIERVKLHLARCMPVPTRCSISTIGSRAGIIGAVATALDHFRETLGVSN